MLDRLANAGANVAIWLLLIIGAAAVVFIAPTLASALTARYEEYQGDFVSLMFLLSAPVAAVMSMLVIVLVLLQRIRADRMFSSDVNRWIQALAISALMIALSILAILVWLAVKNTLPPLVLIALSVGFITALAIASVIRSLLALLRSAREAKDELAAVI